MQSKQKTWLRRIFVAFAVIGALGFIVIIIINVLSTPATEQTVSCANQTVAEQRSVGLIIQDRKLLVDKLHDIYETDQSYSPPGGHVELRETPSQALSREMREELGLTVNPNDVSLYDTICVLQHDGTVEKTYYSLVHKWTGPIKVFSPKDKYKWVTSSFEKSTNAGGPLKHALIELKQQNLID